MRCVVAFFLGWVHELNRQNPYFHYFFVYPLLSFKDSNDMDVRSFLLTLQVSQALIFAVLLFSMFSLLFRFDNFILVIVLSVLPFPFSLYILCFFCFVFCCGSISFESSIFVIAHWSIFKFAALKSLSDNSDILHLGVGIYSLSFFHSVSYFFYYSFISL